MSNYVEYAGAALSTKELTGAARAFYDAAMQAELAKNSLSAFFPDTQVDSIDLRLEDFDFSRPEIAKNRAWDAEPFRGSTAKAGFRTFQNVPISQAEVLSELDQLRARLSNNDKILNLVYGSLTRQVNAVIDALEYQRGLTLTNAKFTATTRGGVKFEDEWGRAPEANPTSAIQFNNPDADILGELEKFSDAYKKLNGFRPGTILVSPTIKRAIARNKQFTVNLNNGGYIPGNTAQVNAVLENNELPALTTYERDVNVGGVLTPVLDPKNIYLLPPSAQGILGNTVFSPTTASMEAGFSPAEQAGIYAGIHQRPTVPSTREVVVDAVAMPVLSNPNFAFVSKVLP